VRRLRVDAAPVDPVAVHVADRMAAVRPAGVAATADELGLSVRQLHRRCTAAFGYGPTVLGRILRVQRALRSLAPGARLAEVAALAGFADQAHLSREVKAIAGATPSELARPIGSRPGFALPATMAS